MIDGKFAEALVTTGLARRASPMDDGSIVYRLRDGSGSVVLDRAEWDSLGDYLAQALKPPRRRAFWLSVALFPAIFVFALTAGQYLPFAGLIILVGIFGGPLAIYLWHSSQVHSIAREVERELSACKPYRGAVPSACQEPRWLEIAFMVLVGPQILIGIVGEIAGPEFYRGTPLSGRGIGFVEIAMILLIAARLFYIRRSKQTIS